MRALLGVAECIRPLRGNGYVRKGPFSFGNQGEKKGGDELTASYRREKLDTRREKGCSFLE